jgi:leucyl-tRNA synthetase
VNPDDICNNYGADTLRLYEMFLGPIEQSKPWDVAGIDGCHRFLKKLWNLYQNGFEEGEPTADNLKSVHKLIKKVSQDIEQFSYNTSISAFMICVNELSQQKCKNKKMLKTLVILIAPFAPHIAEELWHQLGHEESVCDAQWPVCDDRYLVEDTVKYPVQFNGKMRFTVDLPATCTQDEAIAAIKAMPAVRLQLIDGSEYDQTGVIETASGVVDQGTGSVSLRAVFNNPNGLLHTGSTGNVIIPVQMKNHIIVPAAAVKQLQTVHQVFKVVQKDGQRVAEAVNITVSPYNTGKEFIVLSGLKEGDEIIADGAGMVKDGALVK